VFHTHRTNRARNSGGASYFHVSNEHHDRNDALGFRDTDDIIRNELPAPATAGPSCVTHNHRLRLGPNNGAGTPRSSPSAAAFHCRTVRTDAIDRLIDSDDASDPIGHHSHANRWQRDRDHIGSVPARQLVDHRMQLYPGGPADQWRVFAALNPGNSEQPRAWHDSTRSHGACHHQHRSDDGRGPDTKYIGLCREHNDESGYPKHDGAGQCHRRHGNARRDTSIRLLMRERRAPIPCNTYRNPSTREDTS
jgi:hypothetical protein